MNVIVVDTNGTPHTIEKGVNPDFRVCARRFGQRYLIFASSEGDLFDPLNVSLNTNIKDKERGEMFWRLRACSRECYEQYTIFLRSKNRTPYLLAQRRFRNDL